MKVLIINGSPHPKGTTDRALKEIENILHEEGIDTERVDVPSNTPSCAACGYCHQTHEGCIKKDIVNDTYEKLRESDGMIVGSPVYYAGASGSLISFLDRLFYSFPDKKDLHLKAAASIAASRRAGNLAANDAIQKFFSISGMTIITSTYWNDPHGLVALDAEKDEEGLRTMRNLARNMAYYLKIRKLAEENGIKEPEVEKGDPTNFIR
ncbi:MAG: flavodoxin family protein [Erysipelotrichaceae bacterium]|nr:flavodoxin family protein [Erysipelotrichaceae bacterium]